MTKPHPHGGVFFFGECPLMADTVEKLCFEMSGVFICDLNGIAYCMYEGVAEVV